MAVLDREPTIEFLSMREVQSADSPDSQDNPQQGPHFAINNHPSDRTDEGTPARRTKIPGVSTRYALALILLLAIGLRLYGINWDQGGLFHPDERAFFGQVHDLQFPEGEVWSDIFDPAASTLNPGSLIWVSLSH